MKKSRIIAIFCAMLFSFTSNAAIKYLYEKHDRGLFGFKDITFAWYTVGDNTVLQTICRNPGISWCRNHQSAPYNYSMGSLDEIAEYYGQNTAEELSDFSDERIAEGESSGNVTKNIQATNSLGNTYRITVNFTWEETAPGSYHCEATMSAVLI
jgi:hypothetical protein